MLPKKYPLLINLVPWLLIISKCLASDLSRCNTFKEPLADSVVQLTFNCEFDEAQKLADRLIMREPLVLQWKFFRAMILWRKLFIMGRNDEVESQFENETKDIINAGEEVLRRYGNDTLALVCVGGAYGYLGRYYAANGKFFKAASQGKRGLSYLDKVLALCPHWYDAYLGLGLYNYYANDVPWYLKPILKIFGRSGSEKKALEYLNLVAEKGRFAKYEALETLAELYTRRKEYGSAARLYQVLVTQFTRRLFYYRQATLMFFESKEYARAIEIGNTVIEVLSLDNFADPDSLQLGFIHILVARGNEELGQNQKAIAIYEMLIKRRITRKLFSFAYLSKGKLYEKLGDTGQAVECYQRVVDTNIVPQHVREARERLALLSKRR